MFETSGFLLPRPPSGRRLKAVLVGFDAESVEECTRLLQTLEVENVEVKVVPLRAIQPATYLGKGKLEEIHLAYPPATHEVPALIDCVIIDAELTPKQLQNIEKIMGHPVLDRTSVILEIFSRHARTREAKTQVELAKLHYLLPRLAHYWTHFERQRGGIGQKGMGEKQIEVDRRLLRRRMQTLEKSLTEIENEREVQRQGRRDVLKVALVGYTNAGKSTLLNALTHSKVRAEDKLFATLDASIRTLDPNSRPPVVAIDTVGFIRRIPPTLVASFRSTLEELHEADLLVHVADGSSSQVREQVQTVDAFLKELGLEEKRRLFVVNKMDRATQVGMRNQLKTWFHSTFKPVWVSALKKKDVDDLRERILEVFRETMEHMEVVIPYSDARMEAQVRGHGCVERVKYLEKGVFIQLRMDIKWVKKLGLEKYKLGVC